MTTRWLTILQAGITVLACLLPLSCYPNAGSRLATAPDQVSVMTQGKIVEQGDAAQIFAAPRHDYTKALLDSVPGKAWRH